MSPTSTPRHRRRRRQARGALQLSVDQHPRLRIHAAIPEHSQRARHQGAFIRALDEHLDEQTSLGRLRADAATNTRTITWLIVRYTDWHTLTCRIGWHNLANLSGLSRSTIRRVIRRLRDWGFLGVVETGSTWRTRGCREDDEDGDRTAEYVLCIPGQQPVEISDPPSNLRKEVGITAGERTTPTRTRARETRPWPIHQPPATEGHQRQAAERLREQAPVLARLSRKHLARILQPWFDRGWSPAQVRYALDHGPDGAQRWHTTDVRHVPGWIRHRLGQWADHTPPRQLGAGRTTDLDANQVAQLPAAGERSTADVAAHASLARRLLAATLKKRSDKPLRRGLGVNLPDSDGRQDLAVEAPTEPGPGHGDDDGDWLLRNISASSGGKLVGFADALDEYQRGIA